MKRVLKNSRGFTALEVILFVVAVALVGFIAYRAYNNQSANVNSPQPTPAESRTKASNDNPQSANGYLTLDAYKVRIPLNDTTKGLQLGQVEASGYDEADKSVPVLAPELSSTWKCKTLVATDGPGIGRISITTKTQRTGPYKPLTSKKIGSYTYGFESGTTSCTDSPHYQELVDAFKAQFEKMEAY